MRLNDQVQFPASIDRSLKAVLYDFLQRVARTVNRLESHGLETVGVIVIDTATTGVVLKDTQGTPHYWRLTVDTSGALVTTDLGTTKPVS